MVPSRDEIETKLHAFFATDAHGARVVYLFGSVAREAAGNDSDVDVAVLLEEDPPASFAGLPLDLEGELERLLGRPVDVVVLNRAPVDLVHRVLRDSRLVVETDRSARIAFETRARSEYFDLLPTLLRYRRLEGTTG